MNDFQDVIHIDLPTLKSIVSKDSSNALPVVNTGTPVLNSNNVYEYVVSVLPDYTIDQLQIELTTDTTANTQVDSNIIPDRPIEIANERPLNERQTHFYLTPTEAANLINDSRIELVEMSPQKNPYLEVSLFGQQSGNFTKQPMFGNSAGAFKNYAFIRCSSRTENYGGGTAVTKIGSYLYGLDGTGVDVIIMDNGVLTDHPEWEDRYGNSRFVQADWYALTGTAGSMPANYYTIDSNDHGTHCAGTVAGKTFGWAKGAKIYSIKMSGFGNSGGFSVEESFDFIKKFHQNKSIDPKTGYKRPTVVNASWGVLTYWIGAGSLATTYNPGRGRGSIYDGYSKIQHFYRGTLFSYSSTVRTGFVIDGTKGHVTSAFAGYVGANWNNELLEVYAANGRSAGYDALATDLINAGVHYVHASGNYGCKQTEPGDADYNNYIDIYSSSVPFTNIRQEDYHRPTSPYDSRGHEVGSTDTELQNSLDKRAYYSSYGSGVSVWAPGTGIMSASAVPSAGAPYNENNAYRQLNDTGTSMAAPQVAGVLACYLQANPGATPAQAQNWLHKKASSPSVYNDGLTDNYTNGISLSGGPNRFLFWPFSVDSSANTTGSFTSTGTMVTYE